MGEAQGRGAEFFPPVPRLAQAPASGPEVATATPLLGSTAPSQPSFPAPGFSPTPVALEMQASSGASMALSPVLSLGLSLGSPTTPCFAQPARAWSVTPLSKFLP